MKKFTLLPILIILGLSLLLASCATTRLKSRLDPLSEEFYSTVSYIITREESKIFLELPPSARTKFIDEFWERRDSTPETGMNEYKEAYFDRIEEANRLFKGGGRPGWLQDRGRIYVLFGPPDERVTNPMGGQPIDPYADPREMIEGERRAVGEKPTEVWVYYNLFSSMQKPHVVKLVFVDAYGAGDYKLATNLEEVIPGRMGAGTEYAPNLAFTHELYKEEAEKARRLLQRALFDFSWEFIKKKNRELGSNLLIHVVLPFKKIIFVEEEDRLKANLELEIQLKSITDEIIWQFKDEHELNFGEQSLKVNKEGVWELGIPVTQWLEKGNYSVYFSLKNTRGNQEIEKLLPLKM